ncbi:type I polyketide synthase, partial [Streptomyces sp. I05A-00742]|uniref:type I polyketide synthase n=1 Tax=Streptomyces sp. I05A-00742 TaxID=2732853 RepID=UPI00148791BB
PHGTVLITGGTGTLGSLLARHLVQHHHITHLHLISRQGPQAPHAQQLKQDLHTLGAHTVTITACDTTNKTALTHTLNTIPTNHPLTAVIHTAGLVDDAVLTSLSREQLKTVIAAKVDSALNLHELTRDLDLGAFVLFSSLAGVLGSPGQANYSAANTFLDALAAHRQARGLPATSLAWGLWAQASGMTGHLSDQDLARMSRSAVLPLGTELGLQTFDGHNQAHRALQLAAAFNLKQLPAQPIWSRLATVRPTAAAEQQGGPDLAQQLAGLTPVQREQHLLAMVREQMAVILTLDSPDAVEPNRGFLEQGLDSLTAVELRNRLLTITGIRLPATMVFDHPTPSALAHFIAGRLGPGDGGEASPADAVRAATERILSELDRIASMVASVPLADIAETKIPARLHALLSGLTPEDADGDGSSVTSRLDSASAEELFKFIDSEL